MRNKVEEYGSSEEEEEEEDYQPQIRSSGFRMVSTINSGSTQGKSNS